MTASQAKRTSVRTRNRVITVLFVLAITAPLAMTFVNMVSGPGSPREEFLAATPRLPHDLRSALAFPGAFKWYFMERFGMRDLFIHAHGRLKVEWLRTSSHRDIVLGREGWLFSAGDRVFDDRRGARPFSRHELEEWITVLQERSRWLEARGIRFLLVIAPNKETMYPEFLPTSIAKTGPPTRMDQLAAALDAVPEIDWLDLRPAMREARQEERSYYRTDTHWNPIGGWFAARAVVRKLPVLKLTPTFDAPVSPVRLGQIEGGDLARLLGVAGDMPEEDIWPATSPGALVDESGTPMTWKTLDVLYRKKVVVQNKTASGTAVVFRDSFGEALIPWLSQCFGRTVWQWSYEFDPELVEKERPMVVIQQLVERKLSTMGPRGAPVMDVEPGR